MMLKLEMCKLHATMPVWPSKCDLPAVGHHNICALNDKYYTIISIICSFYFFCQHLLLPLLLHSLSFCTLACLLLFHGHFSDPNLHSCYAPPQITYALFYRNMPSALCDCFQRQSQRYMRSKCLSCLYRCVQCTFIIQT